MLVLLIVGLKCTLTVSYLVSYGEYVDGTDDHYITLSTRYGQRNKL